MIQTNAMQVIEMRQAYFAFLLDSNQEERAAELKVREHDFLQGIKLYMKGVCLHFHQIKAISRLYMEFSSPYYVYRACQVKLRKSFWITISSSQYSSWMRWPPR